MTTTTSVTRPSLVMVPVATLAVAYLFLLSWAMQETSFDIWGGLVVAPVLLAITLPLVTRGARAEGDTRMVHILQVAVVAKVIFGTVLRYGVIFGVYGSGDAQGYDKAGRVIAAALRNGNITFDTGGGSEGTRAVGVITGVVYSVIGSTKLGGFMVFSWLAFLGIFLMYKAYRLAVPEGDHHRYAILVFFLPTVLFWPSSLGKEAWLTFTLGISIYGAARILTRLRGGFVLLGLGLWGTAIVRPHLTLLVFIGLVAGYLLRSSPSTQRRLSADKIIGLGVILVVGVLVAGRFQEYFKLDELDREAVGALIDRTAERSDDGDSSYDAVNAARNPFALPQAVLAVLFRPFPFEANNAQSLATSLEATVLLVLFARSPRRLLGALRHTLRNPFLLLCTTYVLLFVVAFSAIGNFGILARQRSLVYPLLLVLLAMPMATAPAIAPVYARPPSRADRWSKVASRDPDEAVRSS